MPCLVSRNITINKKRTSVRLEKHMWESFKEVAEREKMTIHELGTVIHSKVSDEMTFTAAVRVFVMLYFKAAATERGHALVGHGNLKSKIKKIPSHPTKSILYDLNFDSYADG